ncbi:hypothetical protein C8J27_103261 [Rhodobacter aestuarii]|uniref:Uncharacterized protein n=1 Tax=Rhodobacter aestuarii TaxID=453582 RepID=A0A1N7JYV6_9RHOB|nr:hypothetical protein [Rhodobacter aestuarii]PTV95931.1 hypothetical protein C8J27_103261 [Rhodobacter aestuarii]SIS54508.1 hypothetical protein SAMN05421580_102173 [Rhodobacter aestuarii]
MWFDARAKLSEIMAEAPAQCVTDARTVPDASQKSQLSQPALIAPARPRVAGVASVASPQSPKVAPTGGGFPYGTACDLGLSPLTWSGRVVSLDDWRRLSKWEKHGPQGKHWNGITRQWETPG